MEQARKALLEAESTANYDWGMGVASLSAMVPVIRAQLLVVLGRSTAFSADETGVIGDVRGRGAMLAIEIVKPGTIEPDADLTKAVAAEAFARGVVLLTCGTYGNVIRLLPPLVISDELLDEGLTVLADVLREKAGN